ncbi:MULTISPECIES: F0F1 ATP synthase subunit A [unclassified Paenibacillus]|uniref:F0F1 ATP synthase subunit A n=1 Tax=unclassified Paenibacillus TaxID=185978 RepID=UPI002F3FEB1E
MHDFPKVEWLGLTFDIAAIIPILVSVVITLVVARLCVRNLSVENPSKMQNFLEWAVDFMHSTIASSMPVHKVRPYLALGMTLIMFIFISNLLGLPLLINTTVTEPIAWLGITQEYLSSHDNAVHLAWWKSPTADLSVTTGLALIVFVLVHFLGMRLNRRDYLKHYFKPYPIFFPVNLIETIAKPVTLALRLFANIYAGEVLIATILMLGWTGIPFLVAWQGFSIFIGAIQAFLFTVLTMVYISQATLSDEEH